MMTIAARNFTIIGETDDETDDSLGSSKREDYQLSVYKGCGSSQSSVVENEFWESDAQELTQTNPWCQMSGLFKESSPFKAYDQLTRRLDFRIDDLFADVGNLLIENK